MCCVIVKKKEETSVKDQKTLWIQIQWEFASKVWFSTNSSSSSKVAIKIEVEYGINSIEVAFLCDNVRYGSRWIRIVVGLDCVLKVLVSLKGFKIVLVLKDRQQETKDSAGRSSAVWHGSDRWNQRAKFRCVSRFCCIVYFLSRYRFIRFNCKLCTCC